VKSLVSYYQIFEILRCPFASLRASAQNDTKGWAQNDQNGSSQAFMTFRCSSIEMLEAIMQWNLVMEEKYLSQSELVDQIKQTIY